MDLEETKSLLRVPAIKISLSNNPQKRFLIEHAIHSTKCALNDIGLFVERVRSDQDRDDTVSFLNEFGGHWRLFSTLNFKKEKKKLLVWSTTAVNLDGTEIPELLNDNCTALIRNLAADLTSLKSTQQVFTFLVIIDDDQDIALVEEFGTAAARDKVLDPCLRWIYNSPKHLHLQIANILPVHKRAAFSEENLILRPRRTYHNRLQKTLYIVYAADNEHVYDIGENAEWLAKLFKSSFCEIPSSKFQDHKDDNNEAKLLFYVFEFDGKKIKVDRPVAGDTFKIYQPFHPKPCPRYNGNYVRPITEQEDEEDED
ncbi:uncharacterized protein RAG0_03930 [Rhynchosporium agropyri]|uniref:Uncharacterized protein n=1 Tax=Rhynchosporium agropyri TaxID=914238 RepID=A0A1E1K7C9_9HELO|nr:uncharacterized protein RAG0_03930 [Rhynchosporium agropyri]